MEVEYALYQKLERRGLVKLRASEAVTGPAPNFERIPFGRVQRVIWAGKGSASPSRASERGAMLGRRR